MPIFIRAKCTDTAQEVYKWIQFAPIEIALSLDWGLWAIKKSHPYYGCGGNPYTKRKVLRLSVAINKENNVIEMKECRLVII